MTVPVLETERLLLREWRLSDQAPHAAFWTDPATAGPLGGTCGAGEAWRRMAVQVGHWTLRGYGRWVVEEKASGLFAGWSGPWYPEGFPEPEISWSLVKAFQGRGYATEAARRARDFAYRELGWTTAISCIPEDNAASRRVAERLGAVYERPVEIRGHTLGIYRHPSPAALSNRSD
jgi:RimJ/RimL family protein N-acetyltransferase